MLNELKLEGEVKKVGRNGKGRMIVLKGYDLKPGTKVEIKATILNEPETNT